MRLIKLLLETRLCLGDTTGYPEAAAVPTGLDVYSRGARRSLGQDPGDPEDSAVTTGLGVWMSLDGQKVRPL